ncbi:MAG TPA: hypothetical protein VFQ78_09255 [Candidatus Udaeobacter sp.]|nr:hypothetical protein [Candidatus Udaeobacter sp.]
MKGNRDHDDQALIVSKELAARGQLQTAILLWFHYADPPSIHTLAEAQGILQDVAGKYHKHPHMREWIKNFPAEVRRKLRDPQNYFKHADRDQHKIRAYQPYIGTLLIADAALLHQDLYGLTLLIRAFTIRLSFERPDIFQPHELTAQITQGIRLDDLGGLDRPAFFKVILSRLASVGAN